MTTLKELDLPTQQHLLLAYLTQSGFSVYWKLIDAYGELTKAFEAPESQLNQLIKPHIISAIKRFQTDGLNTRLGDKILKQYEWLVENNITLVSIDHHDYPELLKNIRRAPPLLFVKGNSHALSLPQIAVVGSRKPTSIGGTTATNFANELACAGFTITSGLALGVDTCAHTGAIINAGKTIAVMATGIDAIYPARNTKLAEEILDNQGALVTEFIPGTAPKPHHFPQRNRIVSGLSCGLLVVEAAIKSGSLISARYALEQDREVFAIPGSIHSPVSKGCHALIKEGAKLVESAQEMVDELSGFIQLQHQLLDNVKTNTEKAPQKHTQSPSPTLLNIIDFSQTPIDTILEKSSMPLSEVMSGLLQLELDGWVTNTGAGYMRLR